jgi:hypothetical protein
MSKIFEALQYAETERIQLEKMARQYPAQAAANTQAPAPVLVPGYITTPAERTPCNCDEHSYRIRRKRISDAFLRFVGLYPWECTKCRRRFHRSRRF